MSRPKSNKPKPEHLQMLLSKQTKDILDGLVRDTDAASMVEVIRRALHIYHLLVEAKSKGREVILRDKDGAETTGLIL